MIYNPYIVVPAATWAVAQVSKFALAAFRGKLDFRYLYSSGGMPSVHSAVVTSLAVTAFLVDGLGSHLFGFTLIFAFIVMYDSFGVRRSSGEQAAALNMVIEGLDRSKIRLDSPGLKLREILGHQPEEVTVGAIVGLVLGCLFNYDKLGVVGTFLTNVPGSRETNLYFVIGAILIIASLVQRFVVGRRRSATLGRLVRQLLVLGQVIGWLTLVGSVLIYERANYLAWRLWLLALFVIGVVWVAGLIAHWRPRLQSELTLERERERKRQWLGFGRRKRKK